MLSCPATYCNVNGSVYSPASVRNVCRSACRPASACVLIFLQQLRHLLLEHPGTERLPRILRAREHVLAAGLFDEPLEYRFHLAINDQLSFSRPPPDQHSAVEFPSQIPRRKLRGSGFCLRAPASLTPANRLNFGGRCETRTRIARLQAVGNPLIRTAHLGRDERIELS